MLAGVRRGDTIVEVLFAVTVFSLVAVGSLSIMNQGTSASMRAIETTIVRQEIDAQAETLRFLHDAYIGDVTPEAGTPAAQWQLTVEDIGTDLPSTFGVIDNKCPTPPTGSFVMNARTATYVGNPSLLQPAQTFAQVVYRDDATLESAQGIWIEGVRSQISADPQENTAGYVDFHIRACWDAPGSAVPMTLGTIVRLYEPRG